MKYNRLLSLQKSSGKLSKYRLALTVLYELGIDQILLDLGSSRTVSPDHPHTLELNAMENQRALGFRECLEALFELDSMNVPDSLPVSTDYGAIDRLVKEGRIAQADVDSFMKEIENA